MAAEPLSEFTGPAPVTDDHIADSGNSIERLPESYLPVSSLVPGFYLRESGTSSVHVHTLAEAAGTNKLPPILVQKNNLRIIDGLHRLAAAKLLGEKYIRARVIDCTDEEALVLAIRSNSLHGLPLSRADRIAGAKRILAAHADWSDRAVAEIAGLSAKALAVLRNRSTQDIPPSGKRLGRDGKRRPVRGAEGRGRVLAYLKAHPEATLREVAREADVSLGTVHNLRERLRCGTQATAERCGPSATPADGPQIAAAGPQLAAAGPHRLTGVDEGTPDAGSSHPDAANGTSNRIAKRGPRQHAWLTLSSKLASDPSLRYTEGGRAFLRWMAQRAMCAEEWVEFVDAVPGHWAKDVGLMADTIGEEWRMFAARLKNQSPPAA